MGDFETLKEVKQSKNKNTKKQNKGEEMKMRVMNVMVMNEYFGVVKARGGSSLVGFIHRIDLENYN